MKIKISTLPLASLHADKQIMHSTKGKNSEESRRDGWGKKIHTRIEIFISYHLNSVLKYKTPIFFI